MTTTTHPTYKQAREHICTGDLIGIQTGTPGGHLIQAGQVIAGLGLSHITHCAIAMWVGARLLVVEMGPSGNIFKPLSQYAGRPMVVCAPPAGTDLAGFDVGIDRITARHIPYSAADLLRIGVRLLPLRLIDTRGWGGDGGGDKVCSLLPAMVYGALGGDLSAVPKLASPAEVVNALAVRFQISAA